MRNKITLDISDLPQLLDIVGANGERKSYQLRPAGRKFGAFLCQTDEQRESVSSLAGLSSQR